MAADTSQLVGERLKAARLALGWSVRDLAEAGNIALNTISLIERGKTSPTIATLHKLATALGVSLAFFVDDSAGREVIFTRSGERIRARGNLVELENLGSGLPRQSLEPLLLTLDPGAHSGADAITHEGHELVFCLEGAIEYQAGDEVHLMGPGDSLLFEARLPHRWRNAHDGTTQILLIIQADS